MYRERGGTEGGGGVLIVAGAGGGGGGGAKPSSCAYIAIYCLPISLGGRVNTPLNPAL